MVEAGLGVTLLPRSAVGTLSSARIVTVELKSPRIFRELGLITRREYQFSPAAQAFVTVLKQFFAKSGGREEEPAKPRKPSRSRLLVAVGP
jgi:DNA-binding transcriptional LysR family regulator